MSHFQLNYVAEVLN